MNLRVDIPGKPQPKQRPRRARNGRWYTPSKTAKYERLVEHCGLVSRPPDWPRDATYAVEADIYVPDNRRRDLDNVMKAIADGLNGILWDDDQQIHEITVRRHLDRDNPRAELVVRAL